MDDEAYRIEKCRRDPMFYRENLIVRGAGNKNAKLGTMMADFQRRDFVAHDPCLLWAAGVPIYKGAKKLERPMPKVRKFFHQRGRGSSKTTDLSIEALWMLMFSTNKLDGLIVAEDMEQGQLLLKQASKVVELNPWIDQFVDIQRKMMVNRINGGQIKCLAHDTMSSFGETPDFTICDEFTHWTDEEMWSSVSSSNAKQDKMLLVGCNAGSGPTWHWRVRQEAATSSDWYFSAPEGFAPWYTTENMESQRRSLDYRTYNRLWLNKWETTGNGLVDKIYIDACNDPELERVEFGDETVPTYFIAADYADRYDRTVITVSHLWGDKLIIDLMDVFDPVQFGGSIRVSMVKERIRQLGDQFGVHSDIRCVVDDYQLKGVIQDLQAEGWDHEGREIVSFDFRSGTGTYQASCLFQTYILEGRMKWYPGCGEMYEMYQDVEGEWKKQLALGHPEVFQPNGIDDNLVSETAGLIIKKTANGKWRFDHELGQHDDRACTIAMTLKRIHDILDEDQEYYESEENN